MASPGPKIAILSEDNHLLAVSKPAGLVTQGAAAGEPSVVSQVRDYLKRKYAKPGNVYVGVVSRLDAPVTGIVVLARTSKAAARLTEQFSSRAVEKIYWAVVEGTVQPDQGAWQHWLTKDESQQRVVVVERSAAGAQEARLRYRVLARIAGISLLEIALETGRKHQIRVQASAMGHPILGDAKYGSRRSFPSGIALHARRVSLVHPVRKEPWSISAPLPASWKSLGWDEKSLESRL